MSGCSSSASTATLSPWTTLKTPSGTPGLLEELRGVERRGRILLGRLEDERVPQASAGAHIHMGTIAGKLNGVMPATTPSGCRIE